MPYLGLVGQVEVLPLARSEKPCARAWAWLAGYQRGYSETRVKVTTHTGETPTRSVVATDTIMSASCCTATTSTWAPSRGRGWPTRACRGGVLSREFDVDDDARAPLTGSHRLHPSVGLEFSVPLRHWLRWRAVGSSSSTPVRAQSLFEDEGELELEVRELGERGVRLRACPASWAWRATSGARSGTRCASATRR